MLKATKSDLLARPGVRYVKLLDLIVTAWVDKLWIRYLTHDVKDVRTNQQSRSYRKQRVRSLRRATKFIGSETLRLNLRNHLFREQIES